MAEKKANTETQEQEKKKDRIEYLSEQYNVFNPDNYKDVAKKLEEDGYDVNPIYSNNETDLICIIGVRTEDGRTYTKICLSEEIFTEIVSSDPSKNRQYAQWMLDRFVNLVKGREANSLEEGKRFVTEDLPQASEYLKLFDENKRKDKFHRLCKGSPSLQDVKDPSDIHQFKSLDQLFDAVDPFIEKDSTQLEDTLRRYVNSGEAEIPFQDRKVTVYTPFTTDACTPFNEFASWCNVSPGNGMFESYVNNNRTPAGNRSKMYIIIDNNFFEDTDKGEIYQMHIESNQLKGRKNAMGGNDNIYPLISKSSGAKQYFHDELDALAKEHAKHNNDEIDRNQYLKYMIKFGFTDSVFNYLDENTDTIKYMDDELPKLPDVSRFKKAEEVVITNTNLCELHPSIGKLKNVYILALSHNQISSLPKEIGEMENLGLLNICGNPIEQVPEEISKLDPSNGGNLDLVRLSRNTMNKDAVQKMEELLPNVTFGEPDNDQ